jgi:hypothetical protein
MNSTENVPEKHSKLHMMKTKAKFRIAMVKFLKNNLATDITI